MPGPAHSRPVPVAEQIDQAHQRIALWLLLVNLIMTVTLGVFSVTFFILNRPVKHWEDAGDETVAGRDS